MSDTRGALLAKVATYKKEEDRLSALLTLAMTESEQLRSFMAQRLGARASDLAAWNQPSWGLRGCRPDIGLTTNGSKVLAIECKVKAPIDWRQLAALERAESGGHVGRFGYVLPFHRVLELGRSESRDRLSNRVLTWGNIAAFIGEMDANHKSLGLLALEIAIEELDMSEFTGFSDAHLDTARDVTTLLMQAKRLGDAAVKVLRSEWEWKVAAAKHGRLTYRKGAPRDASYEWELREPARVDFYIGFAAGYGMYAYWWVAEQPGLSPEGVWERHPDWAGWSFSKDLSAALRGKSAEEQASTLADLWVAAVSDLGIESAMADG